jgi:copper chaperone CopZ
LAEDIITQELTSWPGVQTVAVEQPTGTVTVVYDPDRIDVPAIHDALRAVDYPATGG